MSKRIVKVLGKTKFMRSIDGPLVHEYMDLTLFSEGEAKGDAYRVMVGFETGGDWYSAISITFAGVRKLREGLDRILAEDSRLTTQLLRP